MTHPLTDEICSVIGDPMIEPHDYTRAGADWQLVADAEWWRIILNEAGFLPPDAVDSIIEQFLTSMRPQGDNQ